MSDSLWPHGQPHAPLPCPSPTPRACSISYPLSQWCYPAISSSVIPFFSCLQWFPASGSFPVNQFFTSNGQIIGVSASASVLPMNIQGWFPLGLTGLIFLQSKGLSSNIIVQKHQFFGVQLLYGPPLTSIQFSSVAQSCPTLCDRLGNSTPGLPVHHQIPESTQTHAHWVGDAIQPSHPLLSPSPHALNLSQHQGLFQWVSSSHQVAKVLEFQL